MRDREVATQGVADRRHRGMLMAADSRAAAAVPRGKWQSRSGRLHGCFCEARTRALARAHGERTCGIESKHRARRRPSAQAPKRPRSAAPKRPSAQDLLTLLYF